MKAIRLKIRVKKQAEKELIKMVNGGEADDKILTQVKVIQDLGKAIGVLKPVTKETVQ